MTGSVKFPSRTSSIHSQLSVASSNASAGAYFDPAVAERAHAQLAAVDLLEVSTLGSPEERLRNMARDPLVTSLRRSLAALRQAHAGQHFALDFGKAGLSEGGFFLFGKPVEPLDGPAFVYYASDILANLTKAGSSVEAAAIAAEGLKLVGGIPPRDPGLRSMFDDDIVQAAQRDETRLIQEAPARCAALLEARRQAKAQAKSDKKVKAQKDKEASRAAAELERQKNKAPLVADILRTRYEQDPYVCALKKTLAQMDGNFVVPVGPRRLVLATWGFGYIRGQNPLTPKAGKKPDVVYVSRDVFGIEVGSDGTEEFMRDVDRSLASLAGGVKAARLNCGFIEGAMAARFLARRRVPEGWPQPSFSDTLLRKARQECDRLTAVKQALPPGERLRAFLSAQESEPVVQTYMKALQKLREKDGMFHAVRLFENMTNTPVLTEEGIRGLGSAGLWFALPLYRFPQSVETLEQEVRDLWTNLKILDEAIIVRGPVEKPAQKPKWWSV